MNLPTTDDLAELLTEEMFASEDLAIAFQEAIQKHKPSLLQLAFAWKVVDRELTNMDPQWTQARDFAFKSFDELTKSNFGNDDHADD